MSAQESKGKIFQTDPLPKAARNGRGPGRYAIIGVFIQVENEHAYS